MGILALLAGLMAWGVCLDHLRFGAPLKRECLQAKDHTTHEAVVLGLTGVALGLTLPGLLKKG